MAAGIWKRTVFPSFFLMQCWFEHAGDFVTTHSRYVTFQMAEVAVPHALFRDILERIDRLRRPTPATA